MHLLQPFISGTLKIRPGEGMPVALLFVLSFFTGLSMVFMETASTALFLGQYPIRLLPVIYIVSAIITTLFGLLYSKAEAYLPFNRLLIGTLALVWLSIAALYAIFQWSDRGWIAGVFMVWFNVCFALTSIGFWGLANRLLNVRQGKRLFGLVGAGEIAAGVLGGLAVSLAAPRIGAVNLLLITIFSLALSLLLMSVIIRRLHARITLSDTPRDSTVRREERNDLNRRYLTLILTTAALSVFGYYVLDLLFYDQLETRFASNEDAIAGFLGIFIAAIGGIKFMASTFLQSRLMERYGLSLGLLAVPVLMVAGTLSALAAGASGLPHSIFWILIAAKTLDEVLRDALEAPSFRILHQPFAPFLRLKAQTTQETIVEPLASALIGGALLLLTTYLGFGMRHLLWGVLMVLAVWIVAAAALRREYTVALSQALSRRRLSIEALPAGDKASIDFLRGKLKSPMNAEVINALNMLEHFRDPRIEADLLQLLTHHHPDIRTHALNRIAALNLTRAAAPVAQLLETEGDPQVIGAALTALCAVSEADAYEQVFAYLEAADADRDIQKGAMSGLLKNGGIDGILAAGSRLNHLLASDIPADRRLAAQILGEVAIAGYYRPLLKLLGDGEPSVRREALRAAGRLQNPKLLPEILIHLTNPDLARIAASAIVALGPEIIPDLETAFVEADQSRQLRIKLVRIIGRIGGDCAIAALKKKLDFPEEDIRKQVLSALVQCGFHATGPEIQVIRKQLREEARDATWTLAVIMDIGEGEDAAPLIRSLNSELEKNRQRIFSLLALVYPAEFVLRAQLNLSSRSRDRRAKAIEILDNLVNREIRELIFPLIDEIPPAQRYARLCDLFPQERKSRHERINELLTRSRRWTTAWTRTCSLFAVGRIATREFHDAVVSCLTDPDEVVRETAVWALGCLNTEDLPRRLSPITRDPSEKVAAIARFVIHAVGFAGIPMGRSGMLTRSGRYSIDLFANMLGDEGERRHRRCRAAHILSRFPDAQAKSALVEGLSISDKTIRNAVLEALIKGDFAMGGRERQHLSSLMGIELTDAQRIVESICILGPVRGAALITGALRQEIRLSRRRILAILLLLSPRRGDVHQFRKHLSYWYGGEVRSHVPRQVGRELRQLIDCSGLDPDRAERLFELFHQPAGTLQKCWGGAAPETAENVASHLRRIAFGSSTFTLSWSRICAMVLMVRLRQSGCVPQLIATLQDPEDVVRATAAWCLHRLSPEAFHQHVEDLKCDPALIVSRTVAQLLKEASSGSAAPAPCAGGAGIS